MRYIDIIASVPRRKTRINRESSGIWRKREGMETSSVLDRIGGCGALQRVCTKGRGKERKFIRDRALAAAMGDPICLTAHLGRYRQWHCVVLLGVYHGEHLSDAPLKEGLCLKGHDHLATAIRHWCVRRRIRAMTARRFWPGCWHALLLWGKLGGWIFAPSCGIIPAIEHEATMRNGERHRCIEF